MRKAASLLTFLLCLTLALPALASPTGASPEEKAIWHTEVPAPLGDPQKVIDVVGPEKAADILSRRVIQSGPAEYVAVAVTLPGGKTVLYYVPLADFLAMLPEKTVDNAFAWPNLAALSSVAGDIVYDNRSGSTIHLMYQGDAAFYTRDQLDEFLANCARLPDSIPFYSIDDFHAGLLSAGDLFDDGTGSIDIQQTVPGHTASLSALLHITIPAP